MTSPNTSRAPTAIAATLSILAGAALWIGIGTATGAREAWDDPSYGRYGLPALALVVAVLGFCVPRRAWLWGPLAAAGQAAVLFAQTPTGNLLPVGLVVFGAIGALLALASAAGGVLRAWLRARAG